MRPIGGIFLAAAVAIVFVLLGVVEIWRRWGTSMAAHREVLYVQRQRDLLAAQEQIRQYRQMIQDYKEQLEAEDNASAPQTEGTEGNRLDSFLMQPVAAAVAADDEPISLHSSAPAQESWAESNSAVTEDQEDCDQDQEEEEPQEAGSQQDA